MNKTIFFKVLFFLCFFSLWLNQEPSQAAWNTGIDVQNLTGTDGTFQIDLYDAAGNLATTIPTQNIAAFKGVNVYLPNFSFNAGQYSAVVSSTVDIAAVASLADYVVGGADIYLGTRAPATTLNFPLVYRNHSGGVWNSKLYIQNAGAATDTNVQLSLFTAGSSTPAVTKILTIPANATNTVDISLAEFAAFGPFGSAVVTGTSLAGVAISTRSTGDPLQYISTSYRAFGTTQKGRDIILPLTYKNYSAGPWTTGINVLNTENVATTVQVTYTSANPAVPGTWIDSQDLIGNQMGVFYTPTNATGLPNSFYGSARITSTAADISIVSASQRYKTDGAQGVAYEGSLNTEATPCVSLPVVHNRTTWKTGINLLNLGAAASDVTINYYSADLGLAPDASKTYTIPANSPLTVYMPTDAATAVGFYGAADIRSTNGQNLLVNVANSRAGVSSNYVGINYTCP